MLSVCRVDAQDYTAVLDALEAPNDCHRSETTGAKVFQRTAAYDRAIADVEKVSEAEFSSHILSKTN